MKQFVSFLFLLFFSSSVAAQSKDTLSSNEQNLVRIFGVLFKTGIKEAVKSQRTDGNSKTVIGNAAKEVVKITARRSAEQLIKDGISGKNILQLPNIITQNKETLIQKGKGMLLQNFEEAMKEAARNALKNTVWKLVEESLEFDVEDLVRAANNDSLVFTDIFKNLKRNRFIEISKPFATNAFKMAKGYKKYRKLKRAYKKITGSSLSFNNETFLAEAITDSFFDEMKRQEQQLRLNPLNVLEGFLRNLFEKKN
jgi:Protein of unknown function (DUF4197)